MITSFEIDNFKSLVNFRLPPAPHALGTFTCLVGLNGAGKSTVLQAFEFIGHLVAGGISDWLKLRDWADADLRSRFLNKMLINFKLEVDGGGLGTITWSGAYNSSLRRCTTESVQVEGHELLKGSSDGYSIASRGLDSPIHLPKNALQFEGSVLSILNSKGTLHPALARLKQVVAGLRSMDMLNPQGMRRRSRDADDIGYGGERLSGYLHRLPKFAKEELLHSLQAFYPQLSGFGIKSAKAGWRDLIVYESYRDAAERPLETAARQVNDGLLRVLAVLAQAGPVEWDSDARFVDAPTGGARSCVLFDEIENGINPELTERLVQFLLGSPRQVVVTTHSPMILNYLPDEIAQRAVILLYRNKLGHTQSVRLFDLPSARRRLALLGPGEAYVDTDLEALPAEAEALIAEGQG